MNSDSEKKSEIISIREGRNIWNITLHECVIDAMYSKYFDKYNYNAFLHKAIENKCTQIVQNIDGSVDSVHYIVVCDSNGARNMLILMKLLLLHNLKISVFKIIGIVNIESFECAQHSSIKLMSFEDHIYGAVQCAQTLLASCSGQRVVAPNYGDHNCVISVSDTLAYMSP